MIGRKRTLVGLISLIVLVFSLQSIAFADQVTSKTFSYKEYKVIDADVRLLLPDDWMYLAEFSNENAVIFSGINGYAALVIQILPLPDYYKENIYALGELFLAYYFEGNSLLSLVTSPVIYDLNGNETMILIYINNAYEQPVLQMEIMAVSNDNIVSVIIQDSEEGFLDDFEVYETILQYLTFNQSKGGILANIILQ